MEKRLRLHNVLKTIPEVEGLYHQRPSTIRMKFPAIVYSEEGEKTTYADNKRYVSHTRYTLTVIDKNPNSVIPNRIFEKFSYCSSDRNYIADGLYHFVFTIYY